MNSELPCRQTATHDPSPVVIALLLSALGSPRFLNPTPIGENQSDVTDSKRRIPRLAGQRAADRRMDGRDRRRSVALAPDHFAARLPARDGSATELSRGTACRCPRSLLLRCRFPGHEARGEKAERAESHGEGGRRLPAGRACGSDPHGQRVVGIPDHLRRPFSDRHRERAEQRFRPTAADSA